MMLIWMALADGPLVAVAELAVEDCWQAEVASITISNTKANGRIR
jgi:hypothetical protein